MAAKLVMVAVPAVLGAASIRVYRVYDAPGDGLATRETLNIYKSLQPSPHTQAVQAEPGVIESGVSAARLTIVPLVQSIKGAYVSVKRGTINVYHAGQDVYYYLKEPPPEFVPRFGTITMAGLLGMFLARKGSRIRRIALPMSLMTAGVCVCYPAQAVAVLKVTGKKAYAAGQWSSASVSSLVSSLSSPAKPAPEAVPSPEVKVPTPKPAAVVEESVPSTDLPSSPLSETEPKSESVQEDPTPTVESSSAPLPETTADQTPTEPASDVVSPAAAETEALPPPEDLPAALENEKPTESSPEPDPVPTEPVLPDPPSEPAPSEPTVSEEPEVAEAVAILETPAVSSEPPTDTVVEPVVESTPQPPAAEAPPSPEDSPAESVQEPELASPVVETPVTATTSPEEPAAQSSQVEPVVELAPEPPAAEAPPPPADSAKELETEEIDPPPSSEETPTAQHTTEPTLVATTETPAETPAETSKGGFRAELMDFGQSDPEDADLYSTRS